jgi:glutamate N-acetyltransferase/amino-acid N-acetyltransferase
MLPIGFKVGGIRSGLSKKRGKKDLTLFFSESPANAAGMFTQNIVKAAPVLIDIDRLKKKSKFHGIIANSGCANACTGIRGKNAAIYICSLIENVFDLNSGSILCASTGIIGQYPNIIKNKFKKSIELLKNTIGISLKNENEAVSAIMTTDTFIKKISKRIKVKNGEIKIWGCAKGAGMIHPNMQGLHATMLSFILTDAEIEGKILQKILENSVNKSFNCVSVDGDTSTNDSIIVLANGQSYTGKLQKTDLKNFVKVFDEITLELAKSIVRDGEGATKFIEIEVKNAITKKSAKLIASTIATSPLFKTAMFGADLNWGRILSAAGKTGVIFDLYKVDIYIGGIHIFKNGVALGFSEKNVRNILLKKEIKITIDLKLGEETSKYYTCDLSYNYVKINSNYRS